MISTETKLEKLIVTAYSLINIKEEEYEGKTRNSYSKRPTPCPQEKQTKSLQDIKNMQSIYDKQDFKSENELANYFEKRFAENPVGLIGNIFSNFDLSDDDFFQIEANLARPLSVDLWEEDHIHKLQ